MQFPLPFISSVLLHVHPSCFLPTATIKSDVERAYDFFLCWSVMNLSLQTLGASPSYGTPSSTCKPFLLSPFPRFLFLFTNLVSEVKVKVHQLFLYCSSLFLIIIFLSLFLSSLSHPTSYLIFVFFLLKNIFSVELLFCHDLQNSWQSHGITSLLNFFQPFTSCILDSPYSRIRNHTVYLLQNT